MLNANYRKSAFSGSEIRLPIGSILTGNISLSLFINYLNLKSLTIETEKRKLEVIYKKAEEIIQSMSTLTVAIWFSIDSNRAAPGTKMLFLDL